MPYIYPLYVLQKKAIRIITDAKYNAHSSPLLKELKILNIQDIHLLNICKFMYDYHYSTLPNALSNIFQSNIDIHNHNTRQYTHHHIQSHRPALASKSIILLKWLEMRYFHIMLNLLSSIEKVSADKSQHISSLRSSFTSAVSW